MVNRRPHRIALAQTTSTDDVEANLVVARGLLAEAAAEGASLLAFPEVFAYVGGRRGKLEVAQPLDGPLVSEFREAAARHGVTVLLGSIHERLADDPQRVANTAVLIGADGGLLASYRKLKLFDVELPSLTVRESDSIAPGREPPPVADTPLGRVGLTICFDLRFPAVFDHLRRAGAELVLVPSNFTFATGAAHWEVLLRARAIENQFYVAAPAQFGRHNERYVSWGHSCVVDPWGSVVALAPERTGLVYAELDPRLAREVRARLPMRDYDLPAGGG